MKPSRFYSHLSPAQRREHNEPIWQRLFKSQRFLTVVLLFLLIAIFFPIARQYSQNREIEKEINDMKQQVAQYQSQSQDFNQMISYLQSDASLEEQARLNLGLKKPGEQVAVVSYPETATAINGSSTNTVTGQSSNWQRWVKYFLN
jgi:cell division protein FtsB